MGKYHIIFTSEGGRGGKGRYFFSIFLWLFNVLTQGSHTRSYEISISLRPQSRGQCSARNRPYDRPKDELLKTKQSMLLLILTVHLRRV